MQYDPIKRSLGNVFNKSPFLRKLFYRLLDLLLLRAWHVHKELKGWMRNAPANPQILDAGAGYGQYSFWMNRRMRQADILAVDVKEEQVEDCNRFFTAIGSGKKVNFIVGDLTKFVQPDRYDLAISVDVMEHIDDDVKVFQNFTNALKSDGYLLINTPSIYGGSEVYHDEDESFVGEHARNGYSKEDFESKLHPLGFKTLKSKYTYGFWGNLAWRLGIKYPIMMVNISKLLLVVLPLYYLITFPFTFIMMLIDFNTSNKVGSGINFIAKK